MNSGISGCPASGAAWPLWAIGLVALLQQLSREQDSKEVLLELRSRQPKDLRERFGAEHILPFGQEIGEIEAQDAGRTYCCFCHSCLSKLPSQLWMESRSSTFSYCMKLKSLLKNRSVMIARKRIATLSTTIGGGLYSETY